MDDLYFVKLQLLQRELIEIKKNAKWKFEAHHQAVYDFVIKGLKSITFTVNDYTITIKIGNENFGFKHLLLRHYGAGSEGEITALDILKIGNVIKANIEVPSKKVGRRNFIQNKNNEKYTVVLTEEKPHDLVFTFFSSINNG